MCDGGKKGEPGTAWVLSLYAFTCHYFLQRKEIFMSTTFEKGERVRWNTPQGERIGVVKKKLRQTVEGHHAKASANPPEYLVRSEKTGAESAHRANALRRVK
jgi:hypothetical protein